MNVCQVLPDICVAQFLALCYIIALCYILLYLFMHIAVYISKWHS